MSDAHKPQGAEIVPLRPRAKCPICGKPSDRTLHPFCSRRCATIDLNHWLSGTYAIPAVEEDDPGRNEGEGSEGGE
jgi:hypothetical protein